MGKPSDKHFGRKTRSAEHTGEKIIKIAKGVRGGGRLKAKGAHIVGDCRHDTGIDYVALNENQSLLHHSLLFAYSRWNISCMSTVTTHSLAR